MINQNKDIINNMIKVYWYLASCYICSIKRAGSTLHCVVRPGRYSTCCTGSDHATCRVWCRRLGMVWKQCLQGKPDIIQGVLINLGIRRRFQSRLWCQKVDDWERTIKKIMGSYLRCILIEYDNLKPEMWKYKKKGTRRKVQEGR